MIQNQMLNNSSTDDLYPVTIKIQGETKDL